MPETNWRVFYYVRHDDRCPIEEFLDNLQPEEQVRTNWHIDRLEEMGPGLPPQWAHHLDDGIFELRIRCRSVRLRVLYFQDGSRFVLTHGFKKKTGAVPQSEIDRAFDSRRDYFAGKKET